MSRPLSLARLVFAGDRGVVRLAQSALGRRARVTLDALGLWAVLKGGVALFRRWVESRESYADKVRREGAYFAACDVDAIVASEWLGVPHVRRKLNQLLGAEHGEADAEYLASWVRARCGRIAGPGLDLGCGRGDWPRYLIDSGQGDHYDALDVAEEWIAAARVNPVNAAYAINYSVTDLNTFELPAAHYAVVFAHDALHHVVRLEHLVAQVAKGLRPGGRFILSDFVGPSRMQWSAEQLRAANALLQLLPESYRRMTGGELKTKVMRADPTFLSPFEAIRSAEIIPVLAGEPSLRRLEAHSGLGLMPILLSGIAQNFGAGDPFAEAYLNLVWDAEQMLQRSGRIPANYLVAVYVKE